MLRCDEDSFTADAIHVDADARFEIVQVNKAVLGDEVDNIILLADLHRYREVVAGFGREKDVYGLLSKGRITLLEINLDDVQLGKNIKQ